MKCCECVCGLRRTTSPFHRGCSLLQLVQQERIESWKTSEKLSARHPERRDGEKEAWMFLTVIIRALTHIAREIRTLKTVSKI